MSDKLKKFEIEDDELGLVTVKGIPHSDDIKVQFGGTGAWTRVPSQASGPYPNDPNAEFGLYKGSRWVYINGKWYKIG